MIVIVSTSDGPKPLDRRVARTRERVLQVARELLHEVGPIRLTYSVLSDRSGVTRQTLYRHWPTQSALLADLVLNGPAVGYPSAHTDPAVVATEFLKSLRAGMTDTTTAGALTALAAHADHDALSAAALGTIVADRCEALNILLSSSARAVSAHEFARLVGPVLFTRFFARQPITDEFIDQTVMAWINEPG